MKTKDRDELLIRIDERMQKGLKEIGEHNKKIDMLIQKVTEVETNQINHLAAHSNQLKWLTAGVSIISLIISTIISLVI